jgi:hypothetical protein
MLSQGALVRAIGLPSVHLDKVRRGPVAVRVDSRQRGFIAAWVPGCPLAESTTGGG